MELYLFLLKMNIMLGVCYGLYRIFLQPLTFFNLNRIFLAAALILSAAAPFCVLTQKPVFVPAPPALPGRLILNAPDIMRSATIDRIPIGHVIYWAGVSLMALIMVVRLLSLMARYAAAPKETHGNVMVRVLQDKTSPFSFFRSIFLNPTLHSDSELITILKHEQVHVRQYHSADILLGEIFRIFCWFNPLAWMLADAIRKNLEFIADRQVLQEGTDRRHY